MYQTYPIITDKILDLVVTHTAHLNLNSNRLEVLIVGNIPIDTFPNDLLGLVTVLLTPLLILGLNSFGFLFLGRKGQLTSSARYFHLKEETHVSVRTRLQRRAANSVIVEAVPFLKRVSGLPVGPSPFPSSASRGRTKGRLYLQKASVMPLGLSRRSSASNDGDADLAILHWALCG
jgi:hypothetical protein